MCSGSRSGILDGEIRMNTQTIGRANDAPARTMMEQMNSAVEGPTIKDNVYESNTLPTHFLPKWLRVENNLAPAVYEQVWNAVKLAPAYQYCDTRIITQFFTTSGLSLEKLGHLWSLSNVSSPGHLTQQELYVMLTSIALVQAGYSVNDISMLKNINHPILPQLDYSYLDITVANPAMNRNFVKNSQSRKIDAVNDDILRPYLKNLSVPKDGKKFNVDAILAPERKITVDNLESNSLVNFSPAFCPPTPNSDSNQSTRVASNSFGSTRTYAFEDNRSRFVKPTYNFAGGANCVDNTAEPKSLDLPIVMNNSKLVDDEDEFTEFQSATMTSIDEYSDFQSVSPIEEYDFAAFKNDSLMSSSSEPDETQSVVDVAPHATTSEIDKYDIFRMLIEPQTKRDSIDENNGEESDEDADADCNDDDDDDDREDKEEFSDFYVAETKQNENNRELTIKEKCLQACLRLLKEGLRIFTSISTEETVEEVLHHENGYRYFNQLKIVYETSLRFQRQFDDILAYDSLQSVWAELSAFIKYIPSDELYDEIPAEKDNDALNCKLCETKCDVNCVRYAGNDYHVTCINLFLHFVEGSEIAAMLYI